MLIEKSSMNILQKCSTEESKSKEKQHDGILHSSYIILSVVLMENIIQHNKMFCLFSCI